LKHNILIIAGILAGMAVILGALNAHYLKNFLTNEQLQSFETGVKFQMYHSLALIGIAALKIRYRAKYLVSSGWAFIIGIILFSFSIYLVSTRELFVAYDLIILAPLTPIGGISLVVGWVLFIMAAISIKKNSTNGKSKKEK
jgi:uncharacterized membrane protein YgdD (TMEM256/DUF423 family)